MLRLRDGNRQIQEITDNFTFTTVYEQNSFVPVARIVERQPHVLEKAKIHEQAEWGKYGNTVLTERTKANIYHKVHTGLRIYHYHNDHLGTPQELTNDRGDVVWLNYSLAWGGSFDKLNNVHNLDGLDVSADELQPIRFQGQFFDSETNLHYNRFRYYDSDVGMFVSRDPIGLMGGNNVFQYAPDPIQWIDPFGLSNILTLKQQQDRAVIAINKLRDDQLALPASTRARVVNVIVTKEGNIITGINNRESVTGYTLVDNAPNSVKNVYAQVPQNNRGNGHGNCAEVCSLGNAVNSNKHLEGAIAISMTVKDGAFIQACASCKVALNHFGIIDAVKPSGKLRY